MDQDVITLVCNGGRARCVIVSAQDQYAPLVAGPCVIPMLQCVRRTVDARTFSVPQCEHSLLPSASHQGSLL